MTSFLRLSVILLFNAAVSSAGLAEPSRPVSFYGDVRPIFQKHCQGCHQPAKPHGKFVITSFKDLLRGVGDEAVVVPGKPDESLLITEITSQDGAPPSMPKDAEPLGTSDVETIRAWIAQGAKDDTPTAAQSRYTADSPPVYERLPVLADLDYSPDGTLLAVTGYHEVLLHKADGSGLVARLVGLSERVESVKFSPDGKKLAVAGGLPALMGEVQIWDVEKRKLLKSIQLTHNTLYGASWSPDGKLVAFGCSDNTVRAVDAETGKEVLYQGAHNDWVLGTAFSKDNSHLVSVSRDRSMKLIQVETQQFIDNVTSITPGALKGGLNAVERFPDRDQMLIGGADGVPKIYKIYRTQKRVIGDDFNLIRTFEANPGRIFDVSFRRDGKFFAVASSLNERGELRVYESEDSAAKEKEKSAKEEEKKEEEKDKKPTEGKALWRFDVEDRLYSVAFSPDGKTVAVGGFRGIVRFIDAETGKEIKTLSPVPVSF